MEARLEAEGFTAGREPALIHPAGTELPTGTAAWLEKRAFSAYHHIRSSNFNEYKRLARRLIGKEVAFVLSGGGSRGFAHAGVYKALREAGIPVDLIGGASMGALVGGALAQGDDYEGVVDGGVMNNFPIDLMRSFSPTGWVIGVNVSPPRELGHDYDFDPGISGIRAILSWLNPFGSKLKVPSIFSILTRSVEVRGIYQMALVADKADVIIRPPVDEFNYLDFRPARLIAEAGYRAAMGQMDEIVAAYQAQGSRLDS